MEQTPSVNLFELQVDPNSSAYLKETAKWAKFLAIIGFIITGLIVLIALFAGTFLASLSTMMPGAGIASGGAIITVVYIGLALINFFPCLYMFNFASKMQVALRSNDQEQLTQSFRNLKSLYRFIGILAVIYLCFIALAFIIGMIGLAATHRV